LSLGFVPLIWLLVLAARRTTHWDNRRISGLVLALLAVVYTLGIPVLRTLAFLGGFVAQVMLVLALFKLA